MNLTYNKLAIIGLALLLSACNLHNKKQIKHNNYKTKQLDYAEKFVVQQKHDTTLLTINTSSKDKTLSQLFTLVKNKKKGSDINTIQVPCKRIICLSSTQLAYFFELDNIGNIVAINSSRYLQHKGMKAQIESGKTKRIGKEGSFQLELIAALNPDVIFVSPFKVGGFDALRNMGIPLVPVAAYNENTPLGRAEWLKMMALFVGDSAKADTLFDGIKTRYNNLKSLCKKVKKRPTVFSGKMRSGTWYVPGGNSFYAHYFRDAGADYIIKDSLQGAYPLDFESIYQKAANCDYWRIVHPEKIGITLTDLVAQDSRYKDFKAYKKRNVLLCNIRQKPYYEQSAVKPDVLLSDYIYYFHPNLVPNHQPVFYEKMQ